jgi:hypothetical protein
MLPSGVGDNLKFRHFANEPSSPGLVVLAYDLVFVFFEFWGNGGVPGVGVSWCSLSLLSNVRSTILGVGRRLFSLLCVVNPPLFFPVHHT